MLDNLTTVIIAVGSAVRAYVVDNLRVTTPDGPGRVRYLTKADGTGYVGVVVDGEWTCHEWPAEQVRAEVA